MTEASIPPGEVSTIRGRWQGPALTWTTRAVLVVAVAGVVAPGEVGTVLGGVAVTAVIAVPLLRVAWLIARWVQEHDRRFVVLGSAVLVVVALGGVLAVLGVGR